MKIYKYIIAALILIFTAGCEENFSPKSDFKENYVLYGVLDYDGMSEIRDYRVYLARTYNVDGFDPAENDKAPWISGADVTVSQGNNDYTLTEDSSKWSNSRYEEPEIFYRWTMKPPVSNEVYTIRATLPGGKKLSASTRIPERLRFDSNYDFDQTGISTLDKYEAWSITWQEHPNLIYFTKLMVNYTRFADSVRTSHSVEVPVELDGGKPVYSEYTYRGKINFDLDAIDYAFNKIAGQGGQITISGATLMVLVYDYNLASYYSSVNGYLDRFSIRLDESTYSNVNGGLGVFGSSYLNRYSLNIDRRYLAELGLK